MASRPDIAYAALAWSLALLHQRLATSSRRPRFEPSEEPEHLRRPSVRELQLEAQLRDALAVVGELRCELRLSRAEVENSACFFKEVNSLIERASRMFQTGRYSPSQFKQALFGKN